VVYCTPNMELENLGWVLLVAGLILVGLGTVVMLGSRLPFFGRLPGDIVVNWSGGSLYIPLVTCLLISLLLTVGLNIVLRLLNRS
jgi:hypothetical protein